MLTALTSTATPALLLLTRPVMMLTVVIPLPSTFTAMNVQPQPIEKLRDGPYENNLTV